MTKFEKGTAAKSMQDAYDRYGIPTGSIIWECHADHIDIFEAHFINLHKNDSKCLNTSIPADPGVDPDYDFSKEILRMSTLEHIDKIHTLECRVKELRIKLKNTKDGTLVEKLESDLYNLYIQYNKVVNENNKLKSRGFFSRLFNL